MIEIIKCSLSRQAINKKMIQSEKGSFTILIVLIVALLIAFLSLNLHKNVDSFSEMEQKEKKYISMEKIKQMIVESLGNYEACTKTFQGSTTVKKIKNFQNKDIFDVSSTKRSSFYKDSGFHEKSHVLIKNIQIIEENHKNFKDYKNQPIDREPMIKYPQGSSTHGIATLKINFLDKTKTKPVYAPIYIKKESGSISSCSTFKTALEKLTCKEQTAKIICCRYIYELTLKPPSGQSDMTAGSHYTATAEPDDTERIGIVKTSEDPDGTWVRGDCVAGSDSINAKLEGFCHFEHNWILQSSCY